MYGGTPREGVALSSTYCPLSTRVLEMDSEGGARLSIVLVEEVEVVDVVVAAGLQPEMHLPPPTILIELVVCREVVLVVRIVVVVSLTVEDVGSTLLEEVDVFSVVSDSGMEVE